MTAKWRTKYESLSRLMMRGSHGCDGTCPTCQSYDARGWLMAVLDGHTAPPPPHPPVHDRDRDMEYRRTLLTLLDET